MRKFLTLAGVFGLTGVGLGAFGAHGLEERLVRLGHVDTWETATLYLFVHTLALLVVATATRLDPVLAKWVAFCWAAGILIFSGSLYVLAFTGFSKLGAVTPVGGLCLIVGWILLVFAGFRRNSHSLESG